MRILEENNQQRKWSAELVGRDRRAVARPTNRIPLVLDSASGVWLRDVDGRVLFDLTSGWNVANLGWNPKDVIEAVSVQLGKTSFAPPWCSHPGRVRVAETLSEMMGGAWKAFSCTTGSEGVEAALKIARRATGRRTVVGFTHAYHGGTLGAMLAGGLPELHGVDLLPSAEHRHAPIPDLVRGTSADYARLARAVIEADPKPAAVLLEPVFTNPGVLGGDDDFYRIVQETAERVGALVIVDEVGTGFGRTGRMFGFEHRALKPDLVVVAKALTSGVVPMAAVLMREDLAQAIRGPGFSSTFGWVPIACAAAEACLSFLRDESLADRADELGKKTLTTLRHALGECGHVAAVRGLGLEIGVELTGPNNCTLAKGCMEILTKRLMTRGYFVEGSAYTSTLLIMPPLVVGESELTVASEAIIEEVLAFDVDQALEEVSRLAS